LKARIVEWRNRLAADVPEKGATEGNVRRSFMDRSYKEDIPSTRRALEELKKEFSAAG